jgi:DNA-binding protein YbaB
MILVFFVLGIAVGITISGRSRPKPVVLDKTLQDRLAVAENLNVSLRQDLNDAKERFWHLEQEHKKLQQSVANNPHR